MHQTHRDSLPPPQPNTLLTHQHTHIPHPLTPRTHPLHDLTLRAFHPLNLNLILPISLAAARLETFYLSIYSKAANRMAPLQRTRPTRTHRHPL